MKTIDYINWMILENRKNPIRLSIWRFILGKYIECKRRSNKKIDISYMTSTDSLRDLLRKNWQHISYEMPIYLEKSNKRDYVVYHNYRCILEFILVLIKDKIYSDVYIDKIILKCQENFDKIYVEWNEDSYDKFFLMFADLINFIEGIIEDAEQYELYVSLSLNIKNSF